MKKHYFFLICMSLGMMGCQDKQSDLSSYSNVDVRTAMQKESPISIKSDVESIEYIPLETNDSCLISNLLNLQISKDYMFMYNGKSGQILQFDRKGKFVRKVSCEGNGPGEYGVVTELAIDNNKEELTVFQYGGPALIYSFKGNYLRSDTTMSQVGGMYVFSDGHSALKGLVMSPIQQSPWAGALKNQTGNLEITKSLYPKSIDENVLFMKEICFSPSGDGVLLFTACNDTVFRINSKTIEPAFVLQRKNAQNYYDAIADINKLSDPTVENDETIGVYDLFETPHYFYARLYKGDNICIQRLNKENGELESQSVPDNYMECSEAIPGNNVIGLNNDMDGGVPFWPEYAGQDGTRAQVVSAYAISTLKEKGYLKDAPSELNISEDSNPVIILYTFKK